MLEWIERNSILEMDERRSNDYPTETLERELASLRAIKDSNPKYMLTTDNDFNPVYDGIRKLNVIDWMLQP